VWQYSYLEKLAIDVRINELLLRGNEIFGVALDR